MSLPKMMCRSALPLLTLLLLLRFTAPAPAQSLEQQLLAADPATLAAEARERGDATRGAIVFYQPYLACRKCHAEGPLASSAGEPQLGPELTKLGSEVTDAQLVDAVLRPSQKIRKGYEAVTVTTTAGKVITGLVVADDERSLVLRDAARQFQPVSIPRDTIDERIVSAVSIMPAGQVNALAGRQQFLDLIKYLIEIRDGGSRRALALEPPPALYAERPLPAYENDIDHAGMIADLGPENFRRGEAIYNRLCINCHGTHDRPGSLPTSLRFAAGKFKNGNDPYTMYQTLTRGFGMMVPQTWMVPQQKYDVIHYIREAYLKSHNPGEYARVDADYLAGLPAGSTRGPEPSNIVPWEQMDYGPNLVATYEIGSDGTNFAYKGNAIRLDPGPGGVSRGRHWMIFDYDTLRAAAAWSGEGFIDWNGINFNGRHAIHPRIVGQVQWANPTGPGWANPATGRFDDTRLRGRDGRAYGPLPRDWAHYQGMYYHGSDCLIAYSVGDAELLELPGLELIELPDREAPPVAVFLRTLRVGPSEQELVMQVAQADGARLSPVELRGTLRPQRVVTFGANPSPADASAESPFAFDGATRIEIGDDSDFEMRDQDYSILARIQTRAGGTIFAQTGRQAEWVQDGKTLFVRDGRLAFDIGWVGVVTSKEKIDDGQWHDVAAVYTADDGRVRLYIDGKLAAQRALKPKQPRPDQIVRIGYTSANFPRDRSFFQGQIERVQFYQRALPVDALDVARGTPNDPTRVGDWQPAAAIADRVPDDSGRGHDGRVVRGETQGGSQPSGRLVAGLAGDFQNLRFQDDGAGNLRLVIPASDQRRQFTVWTAALPEEAEPANLASLLTIADAGRDLDTLTQGGPQRWPQVLTTTAILGDRQGPFAVDVLTHPETNPWFCRLRLTGFDFFPDGDRAAVCSWDGNVWLVSGLAQLPASNPARTSDTSAVELRWQRIASGLYQPLGLKIIDGRIHVTCRDQICILHDLNGDGETDYYENFNNDHQVTDHFHEFAMGLQVDDEGNLYYAKSARHALPALVPHHGTLLRVSKDGRRTEILATGFRAANGVCLNPDGTFIVTDQEGHWNPKNRINWVEPGGFYGNMYGYHDVTDASDEAMQQPLCWITNAFDRSPAELLWVDSTRWEPLAGSLLNLSYGYGKIYVVPFEDIGGQKQGGMCELPLPAFPTGLIRGRFHPGDGQLYACGMFAWAASQVQPGGWYRICYTGEPVFLPVGLEAHEGKLKITFSGPLDSVAAADTSNYLVKVWSLKRTANYGSPHLNEHPLEVTACELSSDGKTLTLSIPALTPTWCMEVKYQLQSPDGQPVNGTIHNTIHQLRTSR